VTSQQQVRNIKQDLLAQLASIKDNSPASQITAAIALLFRWSPRRRQPAWSWLAYGATVAVVRGVESSHHVRIDTSARPIVIACDCDAFARGERCEHRWAAFLVGHHARRGNRAEDADG